MTSANRDPRLSVFLPKEHGSWSLAFEPLVLGLLVVPSVAGAALAASAASAFFCRRPSKALLSGTPGTRRGTRAAAALFVLCAATGMVEASILGGRAALWPLLLAAPIGGLFLFYDLKNEARAASAELAGGTAFALIPAASATLAGWDFKSALALAAVMLARTVPTVIVVRNRLRLNKTQEVSRIVPVIAAIAALLLLVLLASSSLLPWVAAFLSLVLVARAIVLLSPWGIGFSPRRIGITEATLGALYVAGTYLGYRTGHFPRTP